MEIQWRAMTRYHDWNAENGKTPRDLIGQVRSAGIIGPTEWFSTEPDDVRKAATDGEIDRFLDERTPPHESRRFEAGGSEPQPWRMAMLLAPFDPERGRVRGYSTFGLWFEGARYDGVEGSDTLSAAMRSIHTADNTEFAFLHPFPRASELKVIDAPYNKPLTLGPMFAGVLWANFLGPGQLEFFDVERLRGVDAYHAEWSDDTLFLRVSPRIDQATTPTTEAKMFQLTEQFRKALLWD